MKLANRSRTSAPEWSRLEAVLLMKWNSPAIPNKTLAIPNKTLTIPSKSLTVMKKNYKIY
jgi:hypothetical protein